MPKDSYFEFMINKYPELSVPRKMIQEIKIIIDYTVPAFMPYRMLAGTFSFAQNVV